MSLLLITIIVGLLFIARFFHNYLLRDHRPLRLPPGPKGWPIIGALPLLGDKPHEALAKMAKLYGPVMYLKMGTCNMAVASTPSAARAFLKTLDANFANRPETAVARLTYDAQDIVFGEYGPRWKLMRKLSSLHILGGQAIEDWTWIREQEVGHMLRAICGVSSTGRAIAVPDTLSCALANILSQMVLSKRMFMPEDSEANIFKELVVEQLTLAGRFNVGDFISYIAWMDLQGIEGRLRRAHKKFDAFLNEMIKQHVATAHERVGKPDFLDMLMARREDSGDESLSPTSIKALLKDLFLAGTDTTSSVIEWALAELIKNPSILHRAHEEMDQVIGRDRRLHESDLPKLLYLQAICKEVLRKHPSTPLIPRLAAKDCKANGYNIPQGTRLTVNVWAIGRDPEAWEDPVEFMPERFLRNGENAEVGPWGNDFELIPFGSGRRICAGMRLGMRLVEYILGTLVHAFEWHLPSGVSELNMDESFGLTLQKAVPLSANVSHRLSPSVYV